MLRCFDLSQISSLTCYIRMYILISFFIHIRPVVITSNCIIYLIYSHVSIVVMILDDYWVPDVFRNMQPNDWVSVSFLTNNKINYPKEYIIN